MHTHHMPVESEFHGGDDWTCTGIGWDDFSRMAVHTHKLNSARRKETPAWALSVKQTAQVVAWYMEQRSGMRHPSGGTIERRIRRAEKRIRENQIPLLRATIAELCKRYMTAQGEEREQLAILIENRDTQVAVAERGAKLVTGVISYYLHQGWNSVDTARVLHLKPPHVRQLVYRLRRCAAEVERGIVAKPRRREQAEKAIKLRELGLQWHEVARRVGFKDFAGLRRILILEGLYKPTRPGWDGKTFVVDYASARALRDQGLSYHKIAKQLGTSAGSVWCALNRANRQCIPATERHHGRMIDPEKVAALRTEGMTFKQIGAQIGCKSGSAFQALQRWRERQQRG